MKSYTIDPTQLTKDKITQEQTKILHDFFTQHEEKSLGKETITENDQQYIFDDIFYKNISYAYPNPKNEAQKNEQIIFTQDLIKTSRKENDQPIYFYTFYHTLIGTGNFGSVYRGHSIKHEKDQLVFDNTNKAIKIQISKIENEIQLKKSIEDQVRENGFLQKVPYLNSSGMTICREKEFITTYTIMNEIPGIELAKRLNISSPTKGYVLKEIVSTATKKFSSQDLLKLMMNSIVNLIVIQQAGIIHNDIKFENIMLNDKMEMTLIDFGLSFFTTSEPRIVGSPYFISPEKFKVLLGSNKKISEKSDFYSLGLLFRIICGDKGLIKQLNSYKSIPLLAQDRIKKYDLDKIAKSSNLDKVEFYHNIAEKFKNAGVNINALADLLEQMTKAHPSKRLSPAEILKKFESLFAHKDNEKIRTLCLVNHRLFKLPRLVLSNILDKSETLDSCFNTEMYRTYEKGIPKQKK